MKNLRRWQLDSTNPFSLQLAADSRLSRTDYSDDQVWELALGAVDSPALVLQTQYGGRVGLASLIPMWLENGRLIYQAHTYAKPPILTAFTPGYLQAQAALTPTINLQTEFWAIESHAVGARYTLQNTDLTPVKLRLDIFGFVAINNQEQDLGIVALSNGLNALAMGDIQNIKPVVLLENGKAVVEAGQAASPKIGANVEIPAKGTVSIRWVHAGLVSVQESVKLAQHWLSQDWTPLFRQIELAAQAIPNIQTGSEDIDAAIAFSYQALVQSFLRPTSSLPYGSFVGVRQTWAGYSRRGDGSDHHRAWSGQIPMLAYLAASAYASIDPQAAQGIIRNYLAVQAPDGSIDFKPGLGGQRENLQAMPILAHLTWNIFQQTDDSEFLKAVFPLLLKFFERWFQSSLDADNDGLPEWQTERQTGYVFTPTFAVGQTWGQGADIRYIESPDLAAYLLSEALHLRDMAALLKDRKNGTALEKRITTLQAALESLWHDGRYAYRDRDTHQTTTSVLILESGRGDEEHLPSEPLNPPNRLIVRVIGGGNNTPRVTLRLEGLGVNGQKITESTDSNAFIWGYGRGIYTSQNVFSRIDRIRCDGLSRVYQINVATVDTTRLDINALLPLWSGGISQERADSLVKLISDENHFLRPNGVTMTSAQDPAFDPANNNGSGGIWPYWLTLIGEGLIRYGYAKQPSALLKRLLKAQTEDLMHRKKFWEFYHSDESKGLGERGHLAGIVPLHLLNQVLGIRIISSGKVLVGGAFEWGKTIAVTQHGVTVKRSSKGTQIKFPSGYKTTVAANAEWQEVIDPKPVTLPAIEPFADSQISSKNTKQASPKSVIIEVQLDSDDE